MQNLKSIIEKEAIELIIWDFDGVIFDLNWEYQSTPGDFLEELYNSINEIDSSIIGDKDEFISRLFPYPEINEIGLKYGKEIQDLVKSLYLEKETAALHLAVPNEQVIDFIRETKIPQAIWSNNLFSTIKVLLEQKGIFQKINSISSFDKVIMSKPHVEGFQIVKDSFPNIQANKILMIGDSLRSDKVAAENAKIKFFHFVKD